MTDKKPTNPVIFPDPEVAARYAGRELTTEDILHLLPHKPPFLLVDRVIELTPGERALGVKGITLNEPFFAGHFPGHPVMPGVLIIEALAQVAGIVIMTGLDRAGAIAYFTGIKEAKFRQPVRPGCLLQLHADIERYNVLFGRLVSRFKLRATVDGELVAEASCSFALMDETT